MLILTRAEVEKLLDPAELIAALEQGFKALSSGQLNVPARIQVTAPGGVLLGMPAYMPSRPISVKLVSIFHGNDPAHQALINLFDPETGAPLAVMDGEYITALRTAACVKLTINLLARPGVRTIAIIGAGVLARSHLKMMGSLNAIEKILIASRELTHAQAVASLDPRAAALDSIEEAARNADILCLCTSSPEPVIKAEWLKDGVHITSVGYRPPGGELPRRLIETCSLFVESRHAFEALPAGSAELQGIDPQHGTEIGEVLLNQKPGRRSEAEITVYKSMGHAMEDLVAASLVYEKAIHMDIGKTVHL